MGEPVEKVAVWTIQRFSSRYSRDSASNEPYLRDKLISPSLITEFGNVKMEWSLEINDELRDNKFYWGVDLRLVASDVASTSTRTLEGADERDSVRKPKLPRTQCESQLRTSSKINFPFTADCQVYTSNPQASHPVHATRFMTFTFNRQCNSVSVGWPNWEGVPERMAASLILRNKMVFPNDILCIGLRVIYPAFTNSTSGSNPQPILSPNSNGLAVLMTDMHNLLKTGKGSDFTIRCGFTTFQVHKTILAARSPVFDAMFSSNMIETNSNTMKISDVEPTILEYLLTYVYTSSVGLNLEEISRDDLAALFAAADKYQLQELKDSCFQIFVEVLSHENCGRVAVLGFLHNANSNQKDSVYEYISVHWFDLASRKEFQESVKNYPGAFFKP